MVTLFSMSFYTALLSMTILLILGGCKRKPPPSHMPLQPVDVFTLQPQMVDIHTQLPGRTNAIEIAHIRPQVTGIIQKRFFIEGSDVKAGQQLYQIDPSRYQAAYQSAEGQLLQAKALERTAHAKVIRYRTLIQDHAISKQDLDDAIATEKQDQGKILSAKGQIKKAEVDLTYTRVPAPISGRIGRTLVTVGSLVTANQNNDLAVITRLDPIYVDVNMPIVTLFRLRREVASGRIHPRPDGKVPVTLTMDDGAHYKETGALALSEVNVNTSTSTVVVRAIMPNPQKTLLPGMYVHAQLDEGTIPQAMLVPLEAVSRNTHGDPQVWVVLPNNTVALRKIQVGQIINNHWLVTDGLKFGERIVIHGIQKISPGVKVSPHNITPQHPPFHTMPSPQNKQ